MTKSKKTSRVKVQKTPPPVTAAAVKTAALRGLSLVEAGVALQKDAPAFDGNMVAAITAFPTLGAAWRDGAFLASVQAMAVNGVPLEQMQESLKISPADFTKRLARDRELADVLRQATVQRMVNLREGITAAALKGNARALDEVRRELLDGRESAGLDVKHLKITTDGQALFGVSHVTIYDWNKKGCPGIAGGFLDAHAVIGWLRGLAFHPDATRDGDDSDRRLREERIRKIRMENERRHGMLIDLQTAVATRIADAGTYVESIQRIGRMALLAASEGLPAEARRDISKTIDRICDDERRNVLDAMKHRTGLEEKTAAAVRSLMDQLFPVQPVAQEEPVGQ